MLQFSLDAENISDILKDVSPDTIVKRTMVINLIERKITKISL